jgi:hypothetical protein
MFVREFAAAVSLYQDKVNNLLVIWEEINSEVEELKICSFAKERLSETMDKIQRNVDKLNLEAYANLDSWCVSLDQRIELVLIARLDFAVKVSLCGVNACRLGLRNLNSIRIRTSCLRMRLLLTTPLFPVRENLEARDLLCYFLYKLQLRSRLLMLMPETRRRMIIARTCDQVCMRFGSKIKSCIWIRLLRKRGRIGMRCLMNGCVCDFVLIWCS